MTVPLSRRLLAFLLAGLLTVPTSAQVRLPALGEGASEDFSISAERRVGDQVMREGRRDPAYLDDPVLLEYLNSLWLPLVDAARKKGEIEPEIDRAFAWEAFLVRDRSVNAFAMPGGYVGMHLGLMALTTTPDQLVDRLKATEEGRRWWTIFENFLARHGHRGEVELDITTPRWREDPTFLLQSVTNYLRHPSGTPTPPDMMAEGMRRREAAAAAMRAGLPFPLRGLFQWLYERYILWLPFREAMKYTWLLGLEQARRVYRELGRRLAIAGHLKTTDDVFWLRLHEVHAWAESGAVTWTPAILSSREREWREWTALRPPSLIVGSQSALADETVLTVPLPGSRLLRGTPVSAGHAEGVARVITDPHHADLRPGEILVTRYTDPAWTPLFFTAGALITEIGGVLSHGAVVAREIGLPAIVGVEDATARITSGRRVRVDATEGTVELL